MLQNKPVKAFGTLFLALAGVLAAQTSTQAPDLVLLNGRVFTAVDAQPFAEAIAIRGTRIVAVGSNQEISSLAGPKTRRIDLSGHLVIPGINDTHTHFGADVEGTTVDFGGLEPACSEVLGRLRQAVKKTPPGTLLLGIIGGQAFFDPDCTPAALDRVAPNNGIVLWTWTPHAGMLSQAATRKLGVRVGDPPPLGGYFGKNMKSKQWDGVVQEGAWFSIYHMLMSDRAGERARLRRHLDREARWGVTSITIMEVEPERRVELLSAIDSPLRVRLVPFLAFQEQARRKQPEYPMVPTQLSDRVSVTGVKWLLDGTPVERSAAMRAPYNDDPSNSGELDFKPEEIAAILQEALQRNMQPLLHTVGDRTAETLLREMEATGGPAVWSQRRLRMEHGDGLMPDLIPRAEKLGVIVVQNPTHFALGELLQLRLGSQRTSVFQPFRSLLKAGIPVVIASDGGPDAPNLNPFLNILLASAYPGKPQESLSREQAVAAYTRTAAYAEFAEKDKGALEPGKLADLAVLSQDIFKVSPTELPKTESLLTIVGGKFAYSAGTMAPN